MFNERKKTFFFIFAPLNYRTMKKLSLLIGLMAMVFGLNAGPVDQQKAQTLGTRFISNTAVAQRTADIQLNLVSVAFDRSGVDYYAFNVRGGNGFVIVAGDDGVKPILAYSTSGSFNPQDVADGFQFMLNSYREEIHYVRKHNLSATPDIIAEWNAVAKSGQINPGRQARAVVGPLCQTTWHQNFPYNSQCPEDPEGNGGHVYAGCVATAMAQVMKYWDYPSRGTGTHTYNPDGYPQQTANFGTTDYHFELMPLAVDSTSTEEDYFYIAQFQHHCGIAVEMMYGANGSGAYSDDVPPALSNYFGYSTQEYETLGYWGWNFYTNEQWAQMLKDGGLDEQMPLYYSGQDDGGAGGHAFVCDGYDENDYFHFNWGWSGRDDAWCAIGALNTTKYAFNDSNSFIGHIIPTNASYYQRADSVAEFTVVENSSMDGVLLNWRNPIRDLNGNALTAIDSVTIRRNNQLIATLTEAQVGEFMSYSDEGLEPGLYEYAIFVANSAGISRNVYRSILVGEKCEVEFLLHDDGGDGWKGAAISVASESGQRIAIITMTEGSETDVTVPLLRQNLNFVWNHGWYHTNEQYDTDYECSFTVYDSDGNELFASGELEDGIFLTYENNCDGSLSCYPVRELEGTYQWHHGEEYGAAITWLKPIVTTNLDHFRVVRTTGAYKDEVLVAEIPFDGSSRYGYFDNTYGIDPADTYYSVNSVYIRGDEQCESEYMDVLIHITDVAENDANINVYPNPTSGQLNIQGQGEMRIVVSNLVGQKLLDFEVDGYTVVDFSRFGQGVYMLRIETINGVTIQKVSVRN